MADDHIDYLECLEYGDHFVEQAKQLSGLSPIVDIDALRMYVADAESAVATELDKQGVKRSGVRVDRTDTQASTSVLRKAVERFFNYLGSLEDDVAFDLQAFFPGGNLGKLAQVKPADLLAKATTVIGGFAAPANALLPQGAKWHAKLVAARDALAATSASKGTSTTVAIQGTAALVAAREGFLTAYNGVAKRVVLGLLIQQGRRDEHRLFFKDLQVNEGGGAPAAPAVPPPAPPPPSP